MHHASVAILSSGSCGNSILVMGETMLLIDAGLSCKELENRLGIYGADARDVRAVVLTHEHTDHTRGAQRFCRKHGAKAYGTDGTLSLTPLDGVEVAPIPSRGSFAVDGMKVRTFPVKHFAAEPVALTLEVGGRTVGVASDLGCVTPTVVESLTGSDLLLIEANYDDEMLMNGSYPDFLKRTIRSDHGHLSNDDAAVLACGASFEGTSRVVLLHLSRENNTPDKARAAVENGLREAGVRTAVDATEHGGMNGPYRIL